MGSAEALETKVRATRAFFNKPRRERPVRSPLQEYISAEIVRRIPSGDHTGVAVDLGCHWGRYTKVLARSYRRVIGVDFADEALATAAPGDNIEYRKIDLNDNAAALRELAPVDLFTAIALFEMVVDPQALCRHLAAASAPGGMIMVIIPNRRSISYRSLRAFLWGSRVVLRRRDRYIFNNGISLDTLLGYLEQAGYETMTAESMIGLPVYLADRLPHRWQARLLGLDDVTRRVLGGSYFCVIGKKR